MIDAGTAVLNQLGKTIDTSVLNVSSTPTNGASSTYSRTASSVPGETENVLNRYRNVTYNITLAALTPDNLKVPDSYRSKKLKYVIASSKGKGSGAISADIVARKIDITEERVTREGGRILTREQVVVGANIDTSAKETVEEFNKLSPGKFDLFIDGLEVETLLTPNQQTGPAIATKIKFEVFEPMSANGFIEALHVSALAAGWTGYINACYVIRLDFLGYPDDDKDPTSEAQIINATRFFPLKLTGTEMEITETGTRYRVSAVPFNEAGFANPNKLYSDTSFSGNTVREVLESLFEGINKSTVERAAKEKTPEAAKIVDRYEIYFPELPKSGESLKLETVDTEISKASINDLLRSNTVYKFPPIENDPTAAPISAGENARDALLARQSAERAAEENRKRYNPSKNQIQFSKDSNIHEVIESVIRDSAYFKKVLTDVEAAKKGDGMIDYFQIMLNTVPGPMDTTFNRQTFIYQYVICPYKVHYTKLPGQANTNFKADNMKKFVKRIYNYLYTGKNLDVLSFRLNFNNLFFQAANPKLGNNDAPGTARAAGASNDPEVKAPTDGAKDAAKDVNDRPPTLPSEEAGATNGRGQPIQQNPYYQIAYTAHKAILESVNMLTGEIEIIGDPFYLATGGMGNYLPTLKDIAITQTGEANFNNGPVVVRINFRNPIDIDEETGLATFSKTAVPFSGVYQVLKCQSTLRDGNFKQKMNIMRYNGQINDNNKLEETRAQQNIQDPKPGEQQIVDQAPATVARAGVKPNDINLAKWLDRGIPSVGLPGQFANLLNGENLSLKTVTGALGPGAELLNRASGLASGLGIGDALTGISPLAKGIPINVESLTSIAGNPLGNVSALSQVGNQIKSLVPGNVNGLVGAVEGQNVSSILNGVKNSVSSVVNGIAAPVGSLAANLSAGIKNSLPNVQSLDTANLMNNITGKISNVFSDKSTSLTPLQKAAVVQDALEKGIPTEQAIRNAELFGVNLSGLEPDANAIASKLGIDTSQLSGLSKNLDSKAAGEFQEIAKKLSENVDLTLVKEQGVIFDRIAKEELDNIPPVAPNVVAPFADIPFEPGDDALTFVERQEVIEEAIVQGIPVDQALRNAAIFGKSVTVPSSPLAALTALGQSSSDMIAGKISSVKDSLSSFVGKGGALPVGLTGVSGLAGSIEGQISSVQNMLGNPGLGVSQLSNLSKSVTSKFGSLSGSAASPLEKYMNNAVNSLNDPNAPAYTGSDPIIRRRLGLPPIEEV